MNKRYFVVYSSTPEGLSENVSNFLANGWELIGGVQIKHRWRKREFYQSIVIEKSLTHDGEEMSTALPELTLARTREFGTQT